jgi:hypothetical protein
MRATILKRHIFVDIVRTGLFMLKYGAYFEMIIEYVIFCSKYHKV